MKVIIIYGGEKEGILNSTVKIVSNTLKELHIEVEEFQLEQHNIEYYYGSTNKDVQKIVNRINGSDAVIFAAKAILKAPAGIIKVFLEHLTNSQYLSVIKDKYGFCISVTDTSGERECAEYILRAWEILGGADGGRVTLFAKDTTEINTIKEGIEKRIEDFYRIFRQPRQKLPSSDSVVSEQKNLLQLQPSMEQPIRPEEKTISPWMPPSVEEDSEKEEINQEVEIKQASFEHFSEQQEQDIKELTNFFKQQLVTGTKEIATNNFGTYQKPSMQPVVQNKKSCRQMTKNLPHYFQPHLATDFKGTFQFYVSGEENFEGYITIDNGECAYFDGVYESPDIVMIMDAQIWVDILKGKLSAQKGFMTGQLKVRGNFMILNKLEQLFKKM